jgi:hypothetical protein
MLDVAERVQVKSSAVALVFSAIVYSGVAWACARFLDESFARVLGLLIAARTFFGIVEGIAGVLYWRMYGKRLLTQQFVEALREGNFPPRYIRWQRFRDYLGRVEDDEKCSRETRRAATEFYKALANIENTGILAGMRAHAATEAALELYSPKAKAPNEVR